MAASGPQNSPERPQAALRQRTEAPSGSVDPSLLDRVLRATEGLLEDGRPLGDGEREALWNVARRHRDEAISVDPVVVELVEAVIEPLGELRVEERAFWRSTALPVAEAIMEDPVAHERLASLWQRMTEGIR
jgi:hypothetical protein